MGTQPHLCPGARGPEGAQRRGCPHQLQFLPFPWVIFAPPLTHKQSLCGSYFVSPSLPRNEQG